MAFPNRVWERGGWGTEQEQEQEEERGRTLRSAPQKLEALGAGDVGGGGEVASDIQDGATHVEDAVDA